MIDQWSEMARFFEEAAANIIPSYFQCCDEYVRREWPDFVGESIREGAD